MDWQRGKIPFFCPPPTDNRDKMEIDESNNIADNNDKYGLKQDLRDLVNTHKVLDRDSRKPVSK